MLFFLYHFGRRRRKEKEKGRIRPHEEEEERKSERERSLSFFFLSLSLSFSLSLFFYAANLGVFIENFLRAGMRTVLSRTNEIERMQERHTVVRFTINFAAM